MKRARATNTGLLQLPISSTIPKAYWDYLERMATTDISRAAHIRAAVMEYLERRGFRCVPSFTSSLSGKKSGRRRP